MSLKNAIVTHLENETGGSILVRNNGGYVARFSVSYTLNDQRFTRDSGDFTLGVNKSVEIPVGSSDIYVKVEEAWFIASWTTIFTEHFDAPVKECYEIWGTTLNPAWKKVKCG